MLVNAIGNNQKPLSALNLYQNQNLSIPTNSKKNPQANNPSFSSSVAKEFSVYFLFGLLALGVMYYITHQ